MAGFWSSETMQTRLPSLIDPYDPSRVKSCAYELSLGGQVFITGEGKVRRNLAADEQISIPPGQFANLLTEETVRIPDDALGLISMKFTLKQPGLVNVSGFHVDPGYEGKLLFSVYNAGPQSVPITRGTPTFLLWCSDLDQATTDLYSKPPRTAITDLDVKNLDDDVATPQALARRVESLETRFNIGATIVGVIVSALIGITVQRVVTDDGAGNPPTTTISTTSTTAPPAPTTSSGP